ncbi:MAG: hypothetical protein WC879_09890 [Melioribacteraceae bacterium]
MKKLAIIIVLIFFCFIDSNAQSKDDIDQTTLYKIISKLVNPRNVLNTNKLLISDANLINSVLGQLIYYNLPEFDSNKTDASVNLDKIHEYEELIDQNKAYMIIELGDKQIYSIQFLSSAKVAPKFKEIRDAYNLEDMLGTLYGKLTGKQYHYSEINPSKVDTERQRKYDIYFNFLKPEFLIDSWVNEENKTTSRFKLSAEGKWGEDLIVNPGWFYPSYFAGLNLSHFRTKETGIIKELDRPSWSIFVGVALAKKSMINSNLPPKPLRSSGNGIFLRLKGRPAQIIDNALPSFWENFEIEFNGKFNYSKYYWEQYEINESTDIYSNRNYFAFQFKNIHDIQIIDFGSLKWSIGLAFYDIYHYQMYPQFKSVEDLEKDKSNKDKYISSVFAEIGVEKNTNGVFQHDFRIFMNYEPSTKCAYYGFLFNFLINDTFGFDFRYFRNFTGISNLPPWRNDEYFVFSPIIRISN